MFRISIAVVALAGCTQQSDSDSPTDSCGTSAPAIASCVAHELGTIDLDGVWQEAGTVTTFNTQTAQSSSMPFSRAVMITVTGCALHFGLTSGTLDDTNGNGALTYSGSEYGGFELCANADGTLAYRDSSAAQNVGVVYDYDTSATLTRP